MTVQPIGETGVALYITCEDLGQHGITPESLSMDHALHLTRAAFTEAGIFCDGPLEIEAYPNPHGVLVFARKQSAAAEVWFSFSDLEELAAAARSFADAPPRADLFFWEGRYWLALTEKDPQAACRLTEFGRCHTPPPHFSARLSEYGAPIFFQNALAEISTYFPV